MASKSRSSDGCWTCRLRRKKCDELRPVCNGCVALEIDCFYSDEKPEWMDNGPLQKEKADWLKRDVKLKASRRRERRYLHALELGIETLDVSQIDADDSDGGDAFLPLNPAHPHPLPTTQPTQQQQTSRTQQQPQQQTSRTQPQPQPAASLPTPPCSTPGDLDPNESSWGILDRELHTTMLYLDYVFPFLYPFYRPPLLDAGRGWLLVLFSQNKALLHTALSLANHFFNTVLNHVNASQSEPCKTHNWSELTRQQEVALQELQGEMQRIVARGVRGYLVETTRVLASVIQLLTFEVSMADSGNWVMHLDAATELFSLIVQEHGNEVPGTQNATFFRSLLVQLGARPFSRTPRNHPWSADQASLRFSVAFLVFFDTIAATALGRAPRLVGVHQSLLMEVDEREREGWCEDDKVYKLPHIDMSEFIGLQNWIVLGIGEIAALDAWKKEMKRGGALSVAQLVMRAAGIEETLRGNMAALEQANGYKEDDNNVLLDLLSRPGLYPKQMDEMAADNTRIWAQAALTYLCVVVSGWQPACPDLRTSVALTLEMLKALPSPSCMRTIMWPLTITGCMADVEEEETFRNFVTAMGPMQLFGTATKSLAIMENVWANRATIEQNADQWDYAACFSSVGHASLLL